MHSITQYICKVNDNHLRNATLNQARLPSFAIVLHITFPSSYHWYQPTSSLESLSKQQYKSILTSQSSLLITPRFNTHNLSCDPQNDLLFSHHTSVRLPSSPTQHHPQHERGSTTHNLLSASYKPAILTWAFRAANHHLHVYIPARISILGQANKRISRQTTYRPPYGILLETGSNRRPANTPKCPEKTNQKTSTNHQPFISPAYWSTDTTIVRVKGMQSAECMVTRYMVSCFLLACIKFLIMWGKSIYMSSYCTCVVCTVHHNRAIIPCISVVIKIMTTRLNV